MNKENKITWKKDAVAGECAITGIRTQWIAKTEFGSIRCFRDWNVTGMLIWNTIINNKIEQDERTFKRNKGVA